MEKIRMGVSSCLMGEKVRFDGQHKHDSYITGTLGQWFEFVPVCPEFELGLGVPRETMRLEGDPENPRLMTGKSRKDLTQPMKSWCSQRVGELEFESALVEAKHRRDLRSGRRRAQQQDDRLVDREP